MATRILDQLTAGDFEVLLHEKFYLRLEGGDIPLTLQTVQRGSNGSGHPVRAPFSVVLRSESGRVLPQKIYGLAHGRLGVLDLFLVPINATAEGCSYEAVFG